MLMNASLQSFSNGIFANNKSIVDKQIKQPQLKNISFDTVSFKMNVTKPAVPENNFIKKDDTHKIVRKFSEIIVNIANNQGRLTPQNLQKIMKKVLPNSADIPVFHQPYQQMGAMAYCAARYDNGKLETALFADFSLPVPELIDNLVHEFTHVVQMNTKEQNDLLFKSLAKGEKAHLNLESATDAFEDNLLAVVNEVLPNHDSAISSALIAKTETVSSVIDKYDLINEEKLQNWLDKTLKQFNLKEDFHTLNYFKNRAVKESQAHREGNVSFKEAYQMSGTPYTGDVVPELYKRMAEFLETKINAIPMAIKLSLFA